MSLTASRRLAILIGIITPAIETVRRWHQLGDVAMLPFWFDDYLIGGFLLCGAWRAGKDTASGRPVLAAAWGFMCGMAYSSFFGQLMDSAQADPSGASVAIVLTVKGVGLALGIWALIATLRAR